MKVEVKPSLMYQMVKLCTYYIADVWGAKYPTVTVRHHHKTTESYSNHLSGSLALFSMI